MTIDASRQIAETPIIWLRCVDCLQGKDLRPVIDAISGKFYDTFWRCVDLGAETFTG